MWNGLHGDRLSKRNMPRAAWEGAFSYVVTVWLTAFLHSTRTHDEHIITRGLVGAKRHTLNESKRLAIVHECTGNLVW